MTLSFYRNLAATAVLLLAASCMLDWDSLDPSLGEAGAGGGSCEPGSVAACYSGPDGTQGIGTCQAGQTTCRDDGSGFGPCEGEVVPADEDCDLPGDENCDGHVNELEAGCSCTPGELIPCYDGPDGTDGVGICHGGQRLCEPGGQSAGACFGQVLPMVEDCAIPGDESCDGNANEGCPLWAKRYGQSPSNDFPWGLAVEPNGSMVVVGEASDDLDFDGNSLLPSAGGVDMFAAKLDANGDHVWSVRFGDAADSWANDVAIDAAGAAYVVGGFSGTLDFGNNLAPLTAVGTSDAFLVKLNASGVAQWALQLGDGGEVVAEAVAVDGGEVAVAGWFNGSVTLNGTLETSSSYDGFVARVAATSGLSTWGAAFGTSGDDRGWDVALDGGVLYVAGRFDTNIDFGGTPVDAGGSYDGFVAKLNASNAQQWIVAVGDSGYQQVTRIGLSGTDVVAFGDADQTVTVAGDETLCQDDDVYVIKLDSDGNLLWKQHFVGPGNQDATGMTTDGSGGIWIGVSHEEMVDFGGGMVLSAGQDDWALIKLDASGAHLRSLRFGDSDDQDPRGMGVDAQDNLVVGGDCQAVVDFGVAVLAGSSSYEDICLAKLPP